MSNDLEKGTKDQVDNIAGAGTSDKAEGSVKETVGRGKEAVGAATGNDSLRAEGLKDQAAGKAQSVLGDVKESIENVKDNIADALHSNHSTKKD